MPTTTTIATFLLGSLAFALIPGPSVFFILGRALALGRRAALATTAGNCVGVLVIVVAVAFGVGSLIEKSLTALLVVKFLGAGYLIWLGVRTYRNRGHLADVMSTAAGHRSLRRAFGEGVLVGITNPKAIVLFGAILPQFADPSRPGLATQMLILGLLFVAVASMVDAAWATAAGSARDWCATSPTRLRRLGGLGGLILVGMGAGIAATGRHP